jgi:hypothetical protein
VFTVQRALRPQLGVLCWWVSGGRQGGRNYARGNRRPHPPIVGESLSMVPLWFTKGRDSGLPLSSTKKSRECPITPCSHAVRRSQHRTAALTLTQSPVPVLH